MKFKSVQITFQEVPDEVSLSLLVEGCPLRCKGCHSADAWEAATQMNLETRDESVPSKVLFLRLLNDYQGFLTCVCFMGGEWHHQELLELLKLSKNRGLKTCLYTGLEQSQVDPSLLQFLDYLKVGPWIQERGGLNSPLTNQNFIELSTNKSLNNRFQQHTA